MTLLRSLVAELGEAILSADDSDTARIGRVLAALTRATEHAASALHRRADGQVKLADSHRAKCHEAVADAVMKAVGPHVLGAPGIRDPESPCRAYDPGPRRAGADCETDGHYLCAGCTENGKVDP